MHGFLNSVRSHAALAVLAALAFAVAAQAQETSTLKQMLLRNQAVVEAALYETTDGNSVFVLDRTREPPLLKFQGSFEIYALRRAPAAGGDEILSADTGEQLVRMTALGSVILYPRERPMGLPATRLGPADPLPPLAESAPDMTEALRGLRTEAGRVVETPAEPASADADDALLADAARLTAKGLRASAAAPDGAAKLARVTRIQFVYGAGADARVQGGVLTVQLGEDGGYAGRPSSLKIMRAVLAGQDESRQIAPFRTGGARLVSEEQIVTTSE